MAEQLTAVAGEFGSYLDGLLSRLDQNAGWCGVFWHRDPHGMRACREGYEVPPWDVVDALLRDLAAAYGTVPALAERERARSLHAAALAAYDARPGARETLNRRLHATLRERHDADEHEAALTQRLTEARTEAEAEALRVDLAWARDTRHRTTARCAELRDRLARLSRSEQGASGPASHAGASTFGSVGRAGAAGQGTSGPPSHAGASGFVPDDPARAAARAAGRVAPGGTPHAADSPLGQGGPGGAAGQGVSGPSSHTEASTFAPGNPAGAAGQGASRPASYAAMSGPGSVSPAETADQGASGRTSRASTLGPGRPAEVAEQVASGPTSYAAASVPAPDGRAAEAPSKPRKRRRGSARFAGLDDETPAPLILPGAAPATPDLRGARFAGAEAEEAHGPAAPVPHPDDHRAVARAVAHLAALRAAGRSGEVYTLLAEAARWPAVRLPLLAGALTHADWTTLRWEAAALPPEQLLDAATALTAAGHPEEAHRLLREGAARPPEETGAAVARLREGGRIRDARTLLDVCLRIRTPEDAARAATPDPDRLAPLLLEAARHVSDDHHRDLLHALRAAGITP
ncbi:hypothetical protein ACFTT0_01950 [Streptomyces bauhiniae]|uniref:hypothetical protein n=1 Tax=Streptomyces bauhiniae TaxID=2340725 RepID=UPI003637BA29